MKKCLKNVIDDLKNIVHIDSKTSDICIQKKKLSLIPLHNDSEGYANMIKKILPGDIEIWDEMLEKKFQEFVRTLLENIVRVNYHRMSYHYEHADKSKCCGNHFEGIYSDKTKEMQKLQEIVKDIIVDEKVSDLEIRQLEKWLLDHDNLKGFYPYDKIFGVVEAVMLDEILDTDEQVKLLNLLDAFVNPRTETAPISFAGKIVCLSGDFVYGNKKQVEELLCDRGAIIAKSVTSKTDILILGKREVQHGNTEIMVLNTRKHVS